MIMKSRRVFLFTMATVVLGLAVWQVGVAEPAAASPQVMVSAATVTTMLPALGDDDAEYVGANKCKKCHLKQHKSWKESKKASALETLAAGKAGELKTKHGLDPNKDYSKDEACVACHTTGFGKPGGYAAPAEGDAEAAKKLEAVAGVGCESCHGPGGKYMALHEEIMKSKRTYKVDEMYAAGMWKLEEAACVKCHNDKSPTYDAAAPFDFAKMKQQGAHEHFPLTQREP